MNIVPTRDAPNSPIENTLLREIRMPRRRSVNVTGSQDISIPASRQAIAVCRQIVCLVKVVVFLSGCAGFERSHADSRYDCDRNGDREERTAC